MEFLNKYSKQELIQIIKCYEQYLVDWFADDGRDEDEEPVGIQEFIEVEYQNILDAGYTDYNEYMSFAE